jgi:hypothetical protein
MAQGQLYVLRPLQALPGLAAQSGRHGTVTGSREQGGEWSGPSGAVTPAGLGHVRCMRTALLWCVAPWRNPLPPSS